MNLQVEKGKLAWTASKLVDESRGEVATKDGAEIIIWNLKEHTRSALLGMWMGCL
jgi:hypothetical protein